MTIPDHVREHIPLGVVFTVLVQSAGLVWWGASINERMNTVEREQVEQATSISVIREDQQVRGERIAALEAGQRAILDTLKRIDAKLDNIR